VLIVCSECEKHIGLRAPATDNTIIEQVCDVCKIEGGKFNDKIAKIDTNKRNGRGYYEGE